MITSTQIASLVSSSNDGLTIRQIMAQLSVVVSRESLSDVLGLCLDAVEAGKIEMFKEFKNNSYASTVYR